LLLPEETFSQHRKIRRPSTISRCRLNRTQVNQLTKLAHQAGYDNYVMAANTELVKEISKTLKVIRDDGEDN
jgi:hypothetical protein